MTRAGTISWRFTTSLSVIVLLVASEPSAEGLPQADNAKEVFQTIEKKILGSRSLRIDFSSAVISKSQRGESGFDLSGTLSLAKPNKLYLSVSVLDEKGEKRRTVVSDGIHLLSIVGGIPPSGDAGKGKNTPADLGDRYRRAFPRLGFAASTILGKLKEKPSKDGNPAKEPSSDDRVVGLTLKPVEEGVSLLTYGISLIDRGGTVASCALWYRVDSVTPLRREVRIPVKGGQILCAESYQAFLIDSEVPDQLFSVSAVSEGERAFSDIERKLLASENLKVRLKWASDGKVYKGKTVDVDGTALFKGKDRVRVSLDLSGELSAEFRAISDGSSMWSRFGDPSDELEKRPSPKNVREGILVALTRMGIVHSMLFVHLGETQREMPGDANLDTRALYRVHTILPGEKSEEGSKITYVVATPRAGVRFRVTVWYDPKTSKLRKRSVESRRGEDSRTFFETYEEFTFDAVISEDDFKVP